MMLDENLVPFPTLTTERLKLRQLLESDVEEIFCLRSDTKINEYLDRQPSVTLGDSLNFIEKTNENIKNDSFKYWAIELNDSKKLIGTICLFGFSDELRKCEIGYELSSSFQGKGLMTEAARAIIEYAFKTLGLKMIDACTHKANQKSTQLLEKLNFEKTEANQDLIVFRLANKNEE